MGTNRCENLREHIVQYKFTDYKLYEFINVHNARIWKYVPPIIGRAV
jgi:hypothetical protein